MISLTRHSRHVRLLACGGTIVLLQPTTRPLLQRILLRMLAAFR